MVNPNWEDRDFLVLKAAVDYCEENDGYVEVHHLRSRVDLQERDIRKAFNALSYDTPKLFQGWWHSAGQTHRLERPTGEARRRVGLWPTPESLADHVVAALKKAAENTTSESESDKMKITADWFASEEGRGTLVDALSSVVLRSTGAASSEG